MHLNKIRIMRSDSANGRQGGSCPRSSSVGSACTMGTWALPRVTFVYFPPTSRSCPASLAGRWSIPFVPRLRCTVISEYFPVETECTQCSLPSTRNPVSSKCTTGACAILPRTTEYQVVSRGCGGCGHVSEPTATDVPRPVEPGATADVDAAGDGDPGVALAPASGVTGADRFRVPRRWRCC
jgi:hypothetical protein